jgi:hypothetical protein
MNKNIKEANINVRLKNFFKQWIVFTKPFHNLNNRQQEVLALLLYYHYKLNKEITNTKILWKSVFDYDTKVKIYSELDIQSAALENILSQLRKRNVIVNNTITPAYIPNMDKNAKEFSLKINFKIIHE